MCMHFSLRSPVKWLELPARTQHCNICTNHEAKVHTSYVASSPGVADLLVSFERLAGSSVDESEVRKRRGSGRTL